MKALVSCRFMAICLLVIGAASAAHALTKVRNLPSHLGERVTVRVRTGDIVNEDPNIYTARDSYGGSTHIIGLSQEEIIMGATYDITGTVSEDPRFGICINETGAVRTYPPHAPLWVTLLPIPIVVLVVLVVRLLMQRPLPTPVGESWGYIMVESGPDYGKSFALRADEVVIGSDPASSGPIVLDRRVCRRHGRITRSDGAIYYEDMLSKGGSWINEKPVSAGERIPVESRSLIRLGPATVLRVELLSSLPDSAIDHAENWGGLHTIGAEVEPPSRDADAG